MLLKIYRLKIEKNTFSLPGMLTSKDMNDLINKMLSNGTKL